jgi:hypothetical protein
MYIDIYVSLRDCYYLLYVCESFLWHVYDLLLNRRKATCHGLGSLFGIV